MRLAHGLLAGYGRFRARGILLCLCSSNKPEAIDLDWSKILLRCSLRMRVQRVRVICAKARHGLDKDE